MKTLNPRQRQIIKLIWQGKDTKAMAKQLGITVKGIEYHRAKLREMYQVENSIALMSAALKDGNLTL